MDQITRESPAKLNLTLRVLGPRPDGFHALESLVAHINLCDTITATAHEDGCYALQCDDPALPRDGTNLVLRAAKALNNAAGTNHGIELVLRKRIPAGAGLGGGSSNAATTLSMLNELWGLQFSRAQLVALGAALGSDVPLFLHGPLSVVRGRGEIVEELSLPVRLAAALVLPDLCCATPAVYARLDQLPPPPPRPPLREVLDTLGSASHAMTVLFNDLEAAAFDLLPQLRTLSEQVTALAGAPVRLTGSGAALFRLFDDEQSALRLAGEVAARLNVRTAVARLAGP